jgi:methyl-accepting chemotaxis protein
MFSYLLTRKIKLSLDKFKTSIMKISDDKDLTVRIDTDAPLELKDMAISVNGLLDNLKELIVNIKNSSSENASVSHELSMTSHQVGNNVENSVTIINDTTSDSKEIVVQINDAIEEANQNKKDIEKANQNLNQARQKIIDLALQVQDSADKEVELSQKMHTLSHDASEVKGVLTVISDIADQTNLLALNAAIEAARAGEHGRGFAVVADEVRQLAERTQKSLAEINSTINIIVQSIVDVSEQMSRDSENILKMTQSANDVESMIHTSTSLVEDATKATQNTVNEFEKTGKNVTTMVERIEEINSISSSSARSVEEIAGASEHLDKMTAELSTQLEIFKV